MKKIKTEIKTKIKTRDLKKAYGDICKKSITLIKKDGFISPSLCFVFPKGKKGIIIPLTFKNSYQKEMFKNTLLQFLAKIDLEGYITVNDVKMTKIDKATNEMTPQDAIMINLYSRKEKLKKVYIYKNKKVIDEMDLSNEEMFDSWDLWRDRDTKMIPSQTQDYENFKKDNPDEYKSVM